MLLRTAASGALWQVHSRSAHPMQAPDIQAAHRKRLNETFAHMRERISGKLGNRNDNAFRLRKLFAMYDTQRTGKVTLNAPVPLKATKRFCAADLYDQPSHFQRLSA